MAGPKATFNHPDFARQRQKLIPVTFAPVRNVFKAQIQVKALKDVNGWADKQARTKWAIKTGRYYMVDEDTAREWEVKGYAEITKGEVRPVSEDERAEMMSTVTVVDLSNLTPNVVPPAHN